MAARKPPSQALVSLCDRANELGRSQDAKAWRKVGPRQVERWAAAGLLPAVDRPGRGRGRGRESQYRDEHVSAVVEAAGLIRRRRSIAVTAAILFMRGRPISVETLRKSYTDTLDRFAERIRQHAEAQRARLDLPSDQTVDLAELAEGRAAHQLITGPDLRDIRAQLRDQGIGVQATIEVTIAVLLQILTSGQVNEDDLTDLQHRLRLPVIPQPPPERRWLPTDDEIRQHASLAALKSVIATATVEEFQYARCAALILSAGIRSPQGRTALAGYGLADVVDMVRRADVEEQEVALLLLPLIFRVVFELDVIAVPTASSVTFHS